MQRRMHDLSKCKNESCRDSQDFDIFLYSPVLLNIFTSLDRLNVG